MLLLAGQQGDDLVSASELSRREHIPLKYLEQLLSELKKANLVVSHPGARGGYRLARAATEIQVGAIVRALDGPYAPMSCVSDGERTPCAFEVGCKLRPLWSRLHVAVHEVLDRTTLDQLATTTPSREAATEPVDLEPEVMPEVPSDLGPQPQCGLLYMV